jgi:hypothetical protein
MRRPCLIGASVTKLLNYSCLYATTPTCSIFKPQTCINYLNMYHPNVVDETKLSCSKSISTVFECSRQNFMWQRMLSRARLKDWAALKDLAIDRGIFLTTTGRVARWRLHPSTATLILPAESCIGFGPFVEACIEHAAPKDVTGAAARPQHARRGTFALWSCYMAHMRCYDNAYCACVCFTT